MADQKGRGIRWTNRTWNPIRGCWPVSPGCLNCYAMGVAARFSGLDPKGKPLAYYGLAKMTPGGPRWTDEIMVVEKHMKDPLKWKEPVRIFVNSMSDLFHEKLPFHVIDDIFDVMVQADWHTYQILTKRADRMLEYFLSTSNRTEYLEKNRKIWMGVSIENDDPKVISRLDALVQIPAGVRMVSAEPLLSPIDFRPWLKKGYGIQWMVVGGESGGNARPMELQWAIDIRRHCQEAGVACFMKQKGSVLARALGCKDQKGGDMAEWPEEIQVQEYPSVA